MENIKAKESLEKYHTGEITPAELALLESWYLTYKAGDALSPEDLQEEHDLGLQTLNAYLGKSRQRTKLWSRIAAAAAILLVFGTGFYFYNAQHRGIKDKITLAQDIPPGKNAAVLTLGNGETIRLSETKKGLIINGAELIYNDGSSVTAKPANGPAAAMTASTPRGGIYHITLPDGTGVTLNAESSLRFPAVFAAGNREVELTGEAYFEVAKDKIRPFIVKTEGQHIEVLGTHFNVNSYQPGRYIKTTLLEGSVKVTGKNNEVILKPGQQAKLAADGLQVQKVDTEEAVSWKNGYFRFNDENITDVMQKISRWYDVEVQYEGKTTDEGFTGTISRFSNISDVLDMLERTKAVHFEIEGRRITVLN